MNTSSPATLRPWRATPIRLSTLPDHQIAIVTADKLDVNHRDRGQVKHNVQTLQVQANDVDLNGYPHYMLKEIFEQPESIRNTMRGRLDEDNATSVFGGLNLSAKDIRSRRRILLTACGTSWHAALYGEYVIEALSRLPVEVEYASELRYRNPPLDNRNLLFAITQSGETADTLAALREIKRKGHPTLAICNVGRQQHRPRGRRRNLPARRPGNRRGFNQGLYFAVRRSSDACPSLRATASLEL